MVFDAAAFPHLEVRPWYHDNDLENNLETQKMISVKVSFELKPIKLTLHDKMIKQVYLKCINIRLMPSVLIKYT